MVEDQLISLAWQQGLTAPISGKHDRLVAREGEFDVDKVKAIIEKFYGLQPESGQETPLPELPCGRRFFAPAAPTGPPSIFLKKQPGAQRQCLPETSAAIPCGHTTP
ncbi:MAG: hypothetical protein RQM92_09185 [Candidatus Syntrophopropionicum ammoniitolerans]